MAVYWIDPHTTTNGTGTFASPWSLGSSTRTTFASGDEIRIKGVALTSLLLATVYTATVTDGRTLTITAGGSLATDFPVGTVVYIPDFDTFFKVGQVNTTTNQINPNTSALSVLPILDTSVTSVTLRKVDTTTYPASGTGSALYVAGTSGASGLIITDCWTSSTTRVTDGTVKTLVHSTTTSNTSIYPTTSNTSSTSSSADLSNTHILSGNTYGTLAVILAIIYDSNATISIRQLGGSYYSNSNGINLGTSSVAAIGTTVTLYCGTGALLNTASQYAYNCTINITNSCVYSPNYIVRSTSGNTVGMVGCTINLTNVISLISSDNGVISALALGPGCTINVLGVYDQFSSGAVSALVDAVGTMTVVFSSGFTTYTNRRATTQTSFTYRNRGSVGMIGSYILVNPTAPSGYTFTNTYGFPPALSVLPSYMMPGYKQPYLLPAYSPLNTAVLPNALPFTINTLHTFGDGTSPFEVLGVNNSQTTALAYANYPIVATDASVFRTAGPSLGSTLTTRSATVWRSGVAVKAIKNIKIPVTAGASTTVSGYIRTNIATYADGDCRVSIVMNNADIATQSMTTACISAWEQFTFTFTPTYTGEAVLAWEMYYVAAGKYWLDDLTIV